MYSRGSIWPGRWRTGTAGADGQDDRQRCGLASGAVNLDCPAAIRRAGGSPYAPAMLKACVDYSRPQRLNKQDGDFSVMRGEETQAAGRGS